MSKLPSPLRLAIVASHPIQHFVPFYRALARQQDLDLLLIYASTAGLRPYFDREMNASIAWANDMTAGYRHRFLSNSKKTPTSGFFSVYSPDLRGELNRFSPEAIVVYGYSQSNSVIATLWAKSHKVPVGMISDSSAKYLAKGWKATGKRLVLQSIAPLYDCLFTVGDSNETYWRFHGATDDQLVRLPFPIDEEAFDRNLAEADSLRQQIRRDLQIEDGKLIALTVGKLSERKRPMDLLHAMVGDAALCQKLHVVFAGDGELRAELQAFIDQHCLPATLVGFINTDKLPSFYVAADLYVHCAGRDPHPLTLTEAACCGLPLIVADQIGAIGPTDVAQIDVNALEYKTGQYAELGGILHELAEQSSKRSAMGASSRAIYETMTLQTLARTLVETMRRIFQQSARD